jgi:diaminopimelate epimerase
MSSTSLALAKMHGAGNDFVVVGGAPPATEHVAALVRALADRRRGIGADGVLFLERGDAEDPPEVRMHFFNSDGSRAGLCLNGSRCVAFRAVQLGWAREELVIVTDHQRLRARVRTSADSQRAYVILGLAPPRPVARAVRLPEDSAASLGVRDATVVDTGDPHLVVEVDAATAARGDFAELARPLRHWNGTSPAGANVHFVHRAAQTWTIRSFERGVEDETLSCGSGCVSAVCALSAIDDREVHHLLTRSGDVLVIRPGAQSWTLEGPAELSFETRWIRHA